MRTYGHKATGCACWHTSYRATAVRHKIDVCLGRRLREDRAVDARTAQHKVAAAKLLDGPPAHGTAPASALLPRLHLVVFETQSLRLQTGSGCIEARNQEHKYGSVFCTQEIFVRRVCTRCLCSVERLRVPRVYVRIQTSTFNCCCCCCCARYLAGANATAHIF